MKPQYNGLQAQWWIKSTKVPCWLGVWALSPAFTDHIGIRANRVLPWREPYSGCSLDWISCKKEGSWFILTPRVAEEEGEHSAQTRPWMILQREVIRSCGSFDWRTKWQRWKVCSPSGGRNSRDRNKPVKVLVQRSQIQREWKKNRRPKLRPRPRMRPRWENAAIEKWKHLSISPA